MEIIAEYSSTIFSNKFSGDDNGYRVISYVVKEGDMKGTVITGVGYYLSEIPYATYTLNGEWTDTKYGKQFSISTYNEVIPETSLAIKAFLTSGLLRGIGSTIADRIIKEFGKNTLNILEHDIEQLGKIRGISEKKLAEIKESYETNKSSKDIITFLTPYDVKVYQCKKILEEFKEDALDVITYHPFNLMKVKGIGFPTCDKIAAASKQPLDSKERIDAAIIHALLLEESNGNCGTDYKTLLFQVNRVLKIRVEEEKIQKELLFLRENKQIAYAKKLFFRHELYMKEWDVAEKIVELLHTIPSPIHDLDGKIAKWEKTNFKLHPQQVLAVKTALTSGFSVITGGPGRGKTTICKCIIDIRKNEKIANTICLLSPTGRAAKRLSETSDEFASTIHSRLQLREGIEIDEEIIQDDTIIVDEVSMLDIFVARNLFEGIMPKGNVVFVGDIDQLPSVGAGAVLRDIIGSGCVPVIRLTEAYRQIGDHNMINPNADKIVAGDNTLTYDNDSFILYETDDFKTSARYMIALYKSQVAIYGKDEVALLSPHHHAKTLSSCDNLNRYIQEVTNPFMSSSNELTFHNTVFRVNDIVMQTKNVDILSNGDIGYIKSVKKDGIAKSLIVVFDDKEYEYSGDKIGQLELAYASSIHKAQGCEYKCVILNLITGHGNMLKRNLLYTAVTRAKIRVCLVASRAAINKAIANEDTTVRNTLLSEKIRCIEKKFEENIPFPMVS